MKNDYLYITDQKWFESTALKNPLLFNDHKLKEYHPDYYKLAYDLKLLVSKAPTQEEKESPFYNGSLERYATADIRAVESVITGSSARYVLLNGFAQTQFDHIAPLIKDTAEVLYLFKCSKIKDLCALSSFKKLKCLFVYWNNTLQRLWDMEENTDLRVISFCMVSKLSNIDALKNTAIEYITFDTSDLHNHKKDMLFDKSIFAQMPQLKHLTLVYKDCHIDY